MDIAKAAEMQQLDELAIKKYGIPGVVLMENAGQGTVSVMNNIQGPVKNTTVLIFVGPGNNGGDGLVIARHLYARGAHPLVFYTLPPERLRGDAAVNATIVEKLPIQTIILNDSFTEEDTVRKIVHQHAKYRISCIVDALFGTGLTREVNGHMARVVDMINDLHANLRLPVLAVDLPSGMDADTGNTLGRKVTADITVTYGLAKPAHFLHGGKGIGRLHIVDITIPAAAGKQVQLKGSAITDDIGNLLPDRPMDSHKGIHGHLLVLAGSEGKTGAAILCCRAALSSGCGLVTSLVPAALNPIFEQTLIEAMTVALPASQSALSIADVDYILAAAIGKKGVVLGPGIGTDDETEQLVLFLYRELSLPMVVDADALNILALHRDALMHPGGPRIITPHPGEMSRLTGLTVEEIQKDRIGIARQLCSGCDQEMVTVLKGAGTVVADNRGNWAINTSGNQGMATGGMGDVLAGLTGSLLAQGMSVWDAARAGVYLHGLAADNMAREKKYGYTASEVAAMLPTALTTCRKTRGAEEQ